MTSPTETVRAAPARAPWRVVVLPAVWLAVAAAFWWYGDRHHEYDLRIYFRAIRWWSHGHALYDYAQPDRIQGLLGFTYPPFAAILMYPMAWLPLGVVITLSWLANAVTLVITTSWLLGPLAARRGWPGWYLICLALPLTSTLEPIRENVTFGQINLYLALLVLADLLFRVPRPAAAAQAPSRPAAAAAGTPARVPGAAPAGGPPAPPAPAPPAPAWPARLAGVGIGLATAIKLTPGIFIVYLLITRRFRAAVTAAATAAGATGLALLIAPHASWRYWTHTFWQTNRIGHLAFIPNQSLLGMLSRIFRPHQASQPLWLALVAVVAGYGLWRAVRAGHSGDELAGITLTGLVGSLVSPVSWQHHLYWIIPALVILLDVAASRQVPHRRWYAALGVLIWVTVSVSVISFFDYRIVSYRLLDTPEGFLMSNWYVLLMLALLVLLPVRVLPPDDPSGLPVVASWRAGLPDRHPARAARPADGAVVPAGGRPAGRR